MSKTVAGNFFEDFQIGQELVHATPRTITSGDVALYVALTGSRFVPQSSEDFAKKIGYPALPVDDLLAFHVVFGKTVPDVSLNAVANLGYAEGKFLTPVYVGDSMSTRSTVIGLKENSDKKTGVVYVHSIGRNQRNEVVIDYKRWVMVRKANVEAEVAPAHVPNLAKVVPVADLVVPAGLTFGQYDNALAGSPYRWEDYQIGEKIDHVDGMTIEESEHAMATRLYQNTAKVHFNQHTEKQGRFGKRLMYGGHVISLARALSFNGLANCFKIAAINGGRHVAPMFAGDTLYAWSEILDKQELPGRQDLGALRLRLCGVKDQNCAEFPFKLDDGTNHPALVLDFDIWVLIPRH